MALTMACVMAGGRPGAAWFTSCAACSGMRPWETWRSKRTAAHRMAAPIFSGSQVAGLPLARSRDGTCIWPATMPATASRRGIVPNSLPAISRMRFVQAAFFVRQRLAAEGARQRFLRHA